MSSVSANSDCLNEFEDLDNEGPCLPYVNINHGNQGIFKLKENFCKRISLSLQNVRSPKRLVNQFNMTL